MMDKAQLECRLPGASDSLRLSRRLTGRVLEGPFRRQPTGRPGPSALSRSSRGKGLLRFHHYKLCLCPARLTCPARNARSDGAPLKRGAGASAHWPGRAAALTAPLDRAKPHRGANQPRQRPTPTVPARTTCECPAAWLRRATVPRTQPSVGQNSTGRPMRAGPVTTSDGAAGRNPAGATSGGGASGGAAGAGAGTASGLARPAERLLGHCVSSASRSHSSSASEPASASRRAPPGGLAASCSASV